MDELKYELLTEISNFLQADLIKSFLEAEGIDTQLFQESVGRSSFPVTIEMLGRVQIFVPKEKMEEAKELLKLFDQEEQ